MATDIEIIKYRDAGRAQSYGCVTPNVAVAQQNTYFATFAKSSDDAMASTTTAETYTGKAAVHKARLKAVYYVATTGGVATDATNNVTVTVSKRDSAAANPLAIATYTSNVAGGAVTQGVPKAMTLTDANIIIDALSTFTLTVAKGGSGVVLRAGEFIIELERV